MAQFSEMEAMRNALGTVVDVQSLVATSLEEIGQGALQAKDLREIL